MFCRLVIFLCFAGANFCGFQMTGIFLLGTNFCNFLLKQKKINRKENVIFFKCNCLLSYIEGGSNIGVLKSILINSELKLDINSFSIAYFLLKYKN